MSETIWMPLVIFLGLVGGLIVAFRDPIRFFLRGVRALGLKQMGRLRSYFYNELFYYYELRGPIRQDPSPDGYFIEAIADLQRRISHHPGDVDALFRLGEIHLRLAEYEPAEAAYQRILAADPNHYRAWLALGITYLRWSEIENCYKMAGTHCSLPLPHPYEVREHAEKSLECFQRAVEVAGTDWDDHYAEKSVARWWLNLAYMTLGRWPHQVPPHLLMVPADAEPSQPHTHHQPH